jgi:hypothetical protein
MGERPERIRVFPDALTPSSEVLVKALTGESVPRGQASKTSFGLDDVDIRFWQPPTLRASQGAGYGCVLEESDAEQVLPEADRLAPIGVLADAGLMTPGDGHAPAL